MPAHAPMVRLPLGRVPRLLRSPLETLDGVLRGHDLVVLGVGPQSVYLVNHPHLAREILAGEPGVFVRRPLETETERRLLGDSLPGLEGNAHAERRRIVEPALADAPVARHSGAIAGCTSRHAATWRDGATVDVEREMRALAIECLGAVVLGEGHDSVVALAKELNDVAVAAVPRALLPAAPLLWRLPLPLTVRFERAHSAFERSLGQLVRDRRAEHQLRPDLLSRLLASAAAKGSALSENEIHDEVWIYLAQGAVASLLTWCWWALAANAEAERLLHAELDGLPGDEPLSAEWTGLLSTTRAVVLETLRLFPASVAAVRQAAVSTKLADVEVPAGSTVVVSYWSLHRDDRFWPHARRFDVSRWLEGGAEPDAYLPFGAGHRHCPGRNLAMAIAVLALATLARTWRPRPLASSVAVGVMPFLRPKAGLPVRLWRRTASCHPPRDRQ